VTKSTRPAVVLLGAQRFDPSLGAAVSELGVAGRIATITAGWQEREPEDEELSAHLGGRTVNLRLHARGDELFREDPSLRDAHRERQGSLRHRQDFYRIRLEHELEADRVIRGRAAPPEILAEQVQASLDGIRELDQWHLQLCARIRTEFEAHWDLANRPSVVRHRAEVAEILAGCDAIAIAGGHVATLVNRLVLFGIADLVQHRTVFAWSAGAMAISDRVVLFHDAPPQGPGASEILDAGLGLIPNVVVLPEPERRLHLDRKDRVQRLVRRFEPAVCLALPARSRVTWRDGVFSSAHDVVQLRATGRATPFMPRARRSLVPG
jgi:hypothetical protein